MFISAFGPSSSLSNYLVIFFIHSTFSLCFLVAIFPSKIVRFLLYPFVGIFLCHLLPVVDRIFFWCFVMSCFVGVVLAFVDIPLNFFLSSVLFGFFFLKFYCYFFLVLHFFFLFLHIPASSVCFIIFVRFRRFSICVSSRISHPRFDFVFELFEGIPIFS